MNNNQYRILNRPDLEIVFNQRISVVRPVGYGGDHRRYRKSLFHAHIKRHTMRWLSYHSSELPSHFFLIMSDAFSAIIIVGAFVLPRTIVGIMDASTTLRPATPCTFNCGFTTASSSSSGPILQVPTG